jgi:Putative adhesin
MKLTSTILAAAVFSTIAFAQTPEAKMTCQEHSWNHNRLVTHCEIKEQTMPASGGALDIRPGENGGITVNGWNRADVLVRARIQTAASTDAEARAMTPQVKFASGAANLHAEGPETDQNHSWSLDYEIFAPNNSDLVMTAHNGGIHVANVHGKVVFHTVNGGVHLEQVSGDVQGQTSNGGVHISMAGDRWDGKGMDIQTTNGGITLQASPQFSAHVEASSENGGITRDGGSMVRANSGRTTAFDLGAGGPSIHLVTTNGGIKISTNTKAM